MNSNELKLRFSHRKKKNKRYPNKDHYILLSNKECLAHLTIVFQNNDSKYKSLGGKSAFNVNLNLLKNQ